MIHLVNNVLIINLINKGRMDILIIKSTYQMLFVQVVKELYSNYKQNYLLYFHY